MKKFAGTILSVALALSSTGCAWGPESYPGRGPWGGSDRSGFGYWEPRAYSDYDEDRNSDSDTAILGAVLGTAAVIGTVLVVDAIRNQPAPQPVPAPTPRVAP